MLTVLSSSLGYAMMVARPDCHARIGLGGILCGKVSLATGQIVNIFGPRTAASGRSTCIEDDHVAQTNPPINSVPGILNSDWLKSLTALSEPRAGKASRPHSPIQRHTRIEARAALLQAPSNRRLRRSYCTRELNQDNCYLVCDRPNCR